MTTKQTTVRVNGVDVPIEVTYDGNGGYIACEPDWDLGMPISSGLSEEHAIERLRELLEEK